MKEEEKITVGIPTRSDSNDLERSYENVFSIKIPENASVKTFDFIVMAKIS
jgi:hypothetical protein